jgi:aminoglycoside phosphotransferase (APT) family kinase protein
MSEVRPPTTAELEERATAAVQARFPGARVASVEPLLGGASSLTYKAWLTGAGAERHVVLKVAPPGLAPVRNRDVLRQARVLEVLAGAPGVAVPEVLGSDAGAPVEVPPLFVMSFVPGESYEPCLTATEPTLPRSALEARAFAAARMLAALHAVAPTDARIAGEPVLVPHDVRLVREAPRLHHREAVRQERVRNPEVEVGRLGCRDRHGQLANLAERHRCVAA